MPCGHVPLGVGTFSMDNSGMSKEHVGRTFADVDGYCPLAAYGGMWAHKAFVWSWPCAPALGQPAPVGTERSAQSRQRAPGLVQRFMLSGT
jgi:hypothetical protein